MERKIVGCFLKFTGTYTDCKQGSVLCRLGGPGLIFVYNKTRYKILTTPFLSSIPHLSVLIYFV